MSDGGSITDEAIGRLRERIGIPEPHPVAPHYVRPDVDAFRHVAEPMAMTIGSGRTRPMLPPARGAA